MWLHIFCGVLTSEGWRTREHLEQHARKRVNVGTGVNYTAFDLLWCDIVEGAHPPARTGQTAS